MTATNFTTQLPQDEKVKVAYALNLCAVSISQIIDSKDMFVLKQEREFILSNLNLQNFVKHPALFDVLKRILDTITYLEIQAGDMSFIEKEYQHKLKNAIWSAVPNLGVLFAGGNPATLAIGLATQIGTGYMNYRRNKNLYILDRERNEWELKRHEIEQLEGLKAQLFETAWKLSSDFDFDDKYRLTQKQLSRFSEALLEADSLKRYERLDVMCDKFEAFPPYWYYKGNAAMEVFRNKQYGEFVSEYKEYAIKAYEKFDETNFEFLREDILAASCCLEHISLLEQDNCSIPKLLEKAMQFAGDNYDILQQCIFVNFQLKRLDSVVLPLRQMIANEYNVGLNGVLLSRIYFADNRKTEYDKLSAIAGEDNVLPWSDSADISEKLFIDARKAMLSQKYLEMSRRIVSMLKTSKYSPDTQSLFTAFKTVSDSIVSYSSDKNRIEEKVKFAEIKLKGAIVNLSESLLREFLDSVQDVIEALKVAKFNVQIAEKASELVDEMEQVAKR